MRTIETVTTIEAPVEVVWDVITDFPAYPEWNPFITAIEGEPRVGSRLRATFSLAARKPRTFTPTVAAFEPCRQLSWRGRLAIPGLFDAEHILIVRADGPRTAFQHTEHFHGLLVPFLGATLAATDAAFRRMDDALATRAEARVPHG